MKIILEIFLLSKKYLLYIMSTESKVKYIILYNVISSYGYRLVLKTFWNLVEVLQVLVLVEVEQQVDQLF